METAAGSVPPGAHFRFNGWTSIRLDGCPGLRDVSPPGRRMGDVAACGGAEADVVPGVMGDDVARAPGPLGKIRVLLLAGDGPSPKLEPRKRFPAPVVNGEGFNGLRI